MDNILELAPVNVTMRGPDGMTVTNDLTWRRLAEAEGFLTLGMPAKTLAIMNSRANWASMPFEANLLAGLAHRELNDFHAAIIHLEKASKFQPSNPDVALALGWCYKRTNRLAQAIDSLTRAVLANQSEPILHYNLACYWSLAGNVSKSVEHLKLSLRLQPEIIYMVAGETDFDTIRTDPVFQALIHLESGDQVQVNQPNKRTRRGK
jgi:tetratricopeptide (TPR) repeat protein